MCETRSGRNVFDIMRLVLDTPPRLETLLSTPAAELNAEVSADGRFVAYQSDISGRFEVYVSPVGSAERARWKVSVDGGEKPLWSVSGDSIFYRSPADTMMAVRVRRAPTFEAGVASPLFPLGSGQPFGIISGRGWDLSRRDGRFLLARAAAGPPTSGIHVVLNWTGQLTRLTAQ